MNPYQRPRYSLCRKSLNCLLYVCKVNISQLWRVQSNLSIVHPRLPSRIITYFYTYCSLLLTSSSSRYRASPTFDQLSISNLALLNVNVCSRITAHPNFSKLSLEKLMCLYVRDDSFITMSVVRPRVSCVQVSILCT